MFVHFPTEFMGFDVFSTSFSMFHRFLRYLQARPRRPGRPRRPRRPGPHRFLQEDQPIAQDLRAVLRTLHRHLRSGPDWWGPGIPGLVNIQKTMEHGPFIDGLPIRNGDVR